MEHYNPLLDQSQGGKKFITVGEIMPRLTPPNDEKIRMASSFDGNMHGYRPMDMVNFAVASSVIKPTIHGAANITDDVATIRNLMNMNCDIKR